MSILVTGGTGCLGYHLLSLFTRAKGDLISFSHTPPPPYRKLKHVTYYQGNILDEKHLTQVLKEHKPQEIYHVAAQNSVGISQKKPFLTMETNIMGTQCLLEAVRKSVPKSRVLFFSSCEVYGATKGVVDVVHQETDPAIPLTSFATSKSAGELLAHQYINAYNMDVVIIRPFHFTGPFQSPMYVLPSIAKQLVDIERYDGELSIYAGNLDISRDYLDVRDLARAIILVSKNGEKGEVYNICSGRSTPIRELVNELITLIKKPIDIRIDPSLERAVDIPLLVGSPEKMMNLTGWRPIISITDSLKDLYSEMRSRVKMEKKAAKRGETIF